MQQIRKSERNEKYVQYKTYSVFVRNGNPVVPQNTQCQFSVNSVSIRWQFDVNANVCIAH